MMYKLIIDSLLKCALRSYDPTTESSRVAHCIRLHSHADTVQVHVFRRRHEMGCGVCSHALHTENEFENRWKCWPCIRLARGHKHCKCTNTFDDRLRSPIVQNCAFQLFCFINGKMTTLVVSKHNIVVVVCRSVWWVCSTPTQYVQFATGRKRLKT